ncbi:MAG: VWA domain-containing protein [Verrucomicrobia bacterium]|nr:VWA domain-containing protein [Verrucomicrobiota bacterium]
MKTKINKLSCALALAALLASSTAVLLSQDKTKKENNDDEDYMVLSPFEVSCPSMGVTVGGAKDANYFRDGVDRDEFPHPNTITAEGLFSEYDLPLKSHRKSKDLLFLNGEGIQTSLVASPETRYLAQIGFSSGLDAAKWHRDPINLVAVVDKSGSMNGQPLKLVKACLLKVLSQFGPADQMSIVLYGDRSHIYLAPTPTTPANRSEIMEAIESIESSGSTNMEAGLKVGFDLARSSQKSFHGRTRLMQFTDERPNVGNTSAEGFMGLMEAGSLDGIGQTTIGVGQQFGAELASRVSSVRGGNLFYFANATEMEKTFDEELDTMVSELAYDLDVAIQPAPGLKIAGVYGIPGELLKSDGQRGVLFHVSTLFLSKRRGAIYVALAPEKENLPAAEFLPSTTLASVRLSYRLVGHTEITASELALPLVSESAASKGLTRGSYLVSEYLGLKAALSAHLLENNQEKAYALLSGLHQKFSSLKDRKLRKETNLIEKLYLKMGQLAGHGEPLADNEAPHCALDATDE